MGRGRVLSPSPPAAARDAAPLSPGDGWRPCPPCMLEGQWGSPRALRGARRAIQQLHFFWLLVNAALPVASMFLSHIFFLKPCSWRNESCAFSLPPLQGFLILLAALLLVWSG